MLNGQQYITVSVSGPGFAGELLAFKLPKYGFTANGFSRFSGFSRLERSFARLLRMCRRFSDGRRVSPVLERS